MGNPLLIPGTRQLLQTEWKARTGATTPGTSLRYLPLHSFRVLADRPESTDCRAHAVQIPSAPEPIQVSFHLTAGQLRQQQGRTVSSSGFYRYQEPSGSPRPNIPFRDRRGAFCVREASDR